MNVEKSEWIALSSLDKAIETFVRNDNMYYDVSIKITVTVVIIFACSQQNLLFLETNFRELQKQTKM